jgi:hypothetical protein
MPGPVPGIHDFNMAQQNVDGRDKPGHDEEGASAQGIFFTYSDYKSETASVVP